MPIPLAPPTSDIGVSTTEALGEADSISTDIALGSVWERDEGVPRGALRSSFSEERPPAAVARLQT